MPEKIDLLVTPLHRRDGQDQSYLPGLYVAPPPRRVARGRNELSLLLQLTVPAELGLTNDQQLRLLEDMASGYFRTSGSVTSALREQAERLNIYFQQLNQKLAGKNPPLAAMLSMLTYRESRATLGQCGFVQGFLLSQQGIEHFFDPKAAGRGLGLSTNTDIRFHQFEFAVGDHLLLMPELPSGWNETTLSGAQGQKLTTLRRRFLSEAGANAQVVLVSAQPGRGEISVAPTSEFEPAEIRTRGSPRQQARVEAKPVETWEAIDAPEVPELRDTLGDTAPIAVMQVPEPQPTPIAAPEPSAFAIWWKPISTRIAIFSERALPPVRHFLIRMLPEEPTFNLPPQTMALVAALVPLAVVVLVSIVYLQFGRGQLYTNYLSQAQSAAAAAVAREDPAEIRQAWEIVVYYAERAAGYEEDQQAAANLLAQAKTALDEMDSIERVDFQPALFEALPSSANVTRIVATNTDLYMLNSTDGSVLHAFLTGGGFQLDEDFSCEPGPYGGFIVSPLIDLALLPRGNGMNAEILAMDANGNVLYCAQDRRPDLQTLLPPDSNWGDPKSIAIENENLYVLDPVTNAVWIFFGEDFSFVLNEPRFFFGAEVPSIQSMLDMALEEEDLYLLDLDGHISICAFSDDLENPSTCEDPAQFTDPRPGRTNGSQIEDAHFSQIQVTDPPEPSVYLLDPVSQTVYQFSLRLNLVRQFQTSSELPQGIVTAFAVTPNRAIFLAFENEIYIGFMP